MKWIAGIAAAIVFTLLVHLGFGQMPPLPRIDDGGIRVVASVDRPNSTPVPSRPAMSDPTPTVRLPPPPEQTTVAKTDMESLAALFDMQIRDPAWAPGAEAEVRSHMPASGDVRCAEFMCRIAMPLPDRSMTISADQQADTASRRWSADLSYNRLTATIISDRQVPTLIFYATKSDNRSQVM